MRHDTYKLSLTCDRRSSPPGGRHAARPAEAPSHGVAVHTGRVRPVGGPQAAAGRRRRARLDPGSPRLVMARAAADARCSARRLHGAPKDARHMLFQQQEPAGGLGAAGRVLYGCGTGALSVSGVDVAFKQIGSDDRIFLCSKSSPLIHKTRTRSKERVLISQTGAVPASPVRIAYPILDHDVPTLRPQNSAWLAPPALVPSGSKECQGWS